jgi:flavin-dependent dehydrogenase
VKTVYDQRQCDVVIVGAGPAGLSAARTLARLGFSTTVFERAAAPHSEPFLQTAILTPVPGFISGRRLFDELFFPSLDFVVPSSLILGYPPVQKFISPNGYTFRASFGSRAGFPAAVVDKRAVLKLLAEQAGSAGARLQYQAPVDGLLIESGRVVGVRAGGSTLRAQIVMSAEGVARRLCEEAGLYEGSSPLQHGLLISQEMEASCATAADLGQIVTFGSRYTSAPMAFGTVSVAVPGRASVFFTVFADSLQHHPERLGWFYIDEYVARDARVREVLKGARALHRAQQPLMVRQSPARLVADGFLGLGDAVTPAGHVGVLPAMYLGRQAALIAAEAVDSGDVSALALAPYEQLLRSAILPNLEAENRLLACLTRMTDEELDRLCQGLQNVPAPTAFFSNWRTLTWEMMSWIVQQLPRVVQDWERLQSLMLGEQIDRAL